MSFTWAESIYYRDYRVQERYGKYRLSYQVGGYQNDWTDHVQYPTGGYHTTYVLNTTFTHCVPVSAGVWTLSSTSANAFSLSGGVKIAGTLGIDLSVATDYSSSHTINYRLVSTGTVCGDNAVPSSASNANTSR